MDSDRDNESDVGPDQVVLEDDPEDGAVGFMGAPAGPAGLATAELGAGVELHVDWADPARVVWVGILGDVELRPEGLAAVDALLGPNARQALLTRPSNDGGRQSVTAPAKLTVFEGGQEARVLAGRYALLENLRTDDADASAWWAGECASLLARLAERDLGHLRSWAKAEALVATDGILSIDAESLAPILAERVVQVVADLISVTDSATAVSALEDLRHRLHQQLDTERATAEGASLLAAAAAAVAQVKRWIIRPEPRLEAVGATRDSRGEDAPIPAGAVTWKRTLEAWLSERGVDTIRGMTLTWSSSAGELIVRLPLARLDARVDGLWVRVFDPHWQLLTMARVQPSDATDDPSPPSSPATALARLSLAPSTEVPSCHVEITEDPEAVPAYSPLTRFRAACRLGQTAAKAERLGAVGEAADLWHECAHAWNGTGDTQRSALARAYVAQARLRSSEPKLRSSAHAVLAVAKQEAGAGWARRLLEHPRLAPEPFLAEWALPVNEE